MPRENVHALTLSGLSLIDYVLFYATNILLARTLSVRDFDDYAVPNSLLYGILRLVALRDIATQSRIEYSVVFSLVFRGESWVA